MSSPAVGREGGVSPPELMRQVGSPAPINMLTMAMGVPNIQHCYRLLCGESIYLRPPTASDIAVLDYPRVEVAWTHPLQVFTSR